jgi:hypothetical protein
LTPARGPGWGWWGGGGEEEVSPSPALGEVENDGERDNDIDDDDGDEDAIIIIIAAAVVGARQRIDASFDPAGDKRRARAMSTDLNQRGERCGLDAVGGGVLKREFRLGALSRSRR